jgi:hypothetical protein
MTLPDYYDKIIDEKKANAYYNKLVKLAKSHIEEWDLDEVYNFCKEHNLHLD